MWNDVTVQHLADGGEKRSLAVDDDLVENRHAVLTPCSVTGTDTDGLSPQTGSVTGTDTLYNLIPI